KLDILEGLYAMATERWHLAPAAPVGPIAAADALPDPMDRRTPDSGRLDTVQQAVDLAVAASLRRPQAMLSPPLAEFVAGLSPDAIKTLVGEALAIERRVGGRTATEFLLGRIGMRCSTEIDERYYAEAMHYHLGLLYAHAGQPAEMAEQFRLSRTMP